MEGVGGPPPKHGVLVEALQRNDFFCRILGLWRLVVSSGSVGIRIYVRLGMDGHCVGVGLELGYCWWIRYIVLYCTGKLLQVCRLGLQNPFLFVSLGMCT